jgi:predicted nucleic acid-binding protein
MDEASGIFNAWADKKLSLTDTVSFAVCHRLGIKTALSLDEHFREAGFQVLPDLRRR